jgi:hypothetical protein
MRAPKAPLPNAPAPVYSPSVGVRYFGGFGGWGFGYPTIPVVTPRFCTTRTCSGSVRSNSSILFAGVVSLLMDASLARKEKGRPGGALRVHCDLVVVRGSVLTHPEYRRGCMRRLRARCHGRRNARTSFGKAKRSAPNIPTTRCAIHVGRSTSLSGSHRQPQPQPPQPLQPLQALHPRQPLHPLQPH